MSPGEKLIAAARAGSCAQLREALDLGAAANYTDCEAGSTGLMYACERADPELGLALVKLLLAEGASTEAANRHEWVALHYACRRSSADVVTLLLEHRCQVDPVSGNGLTPLHICCSTRDDAEGLRICELLLEYGADLELRHRRGRNALLCAARSGTAAMLALLFDRGAAATSTQGMRWTALHYCAERQDEEAVRAMHVLLDRGALIEVEDGLGRTALLVAAMFAGQPMVQTLLARGASINAVDHCHESALMIASRRYDYTVAAAVVQTLLAFGAPLDLVCQDGETALHYAAYDSSARVVAILLEAGCQVNAQEKKGRSPLHLVCARVDDDAVPIARLLLDHGASTSLLTVNGASPLTYAALLGLHDMVELLIVQGGASVNHSDHSGQTPLMGACRNSLCGVSIIPLLMRNGAELRVEDRLGLTAIRYAFAFGGGALVEAVGQFYPVPERHTVLARSLPSPAASDLVGSMRTGVVYGFTIEPGTVAQVSHRYANSATFCKNFTIKKSTYFKRKVAELASP